MEASAAASAEVPTAVAPTGAASAAAPTGAASAAAPTGAASAEVPMEAAAEAGAAAPDSESIDITVLRCCDGS